MKVQFVTKRDKPRGMCQLNKNSGHSGTITDQFLQTIMFPGTKKKVFGLESAFTAI
jgi:hypothetical protein